MRDGNRRGVSDGVRNGYRRPVRMSNGDVMGEEEGNGREGEVRSAGVQPQNFTLMNTLIHCTLIETYVYFFIQLSSCANSP